VHAQQKKLFKKLRQRQGDQIGRIFAYVLGDGLLRVVFRKLQKYLKFLGCFFNGKSYFLL
jgi:hypothetical protein